MTQGSLFPLRVKHHLPPRGRGCDLRVEALGEDGMEWALKRQAEHPMLPASEFLCYRIAQACALATPFDAILQDLDGSPVFGSRIEAGLVELQSLPQADAIAGIASCAGRMSACCALDLVLGNEDRHFNNFLYRQRSDGGLAAIVIDWSRAWWVRGWPPQTVAGCPCNTTNSIVMLRALGMWAAQEAVLALSTLRSVPAATVESWLSQMPAPWLAQTDRDTLLSWWGSQAFHQRIADCVTYC